MTPDFWYILGHDYEVIVFQTREAAERHKADLDREDESNPDYYEIFEGRFEHEFSGWIGRE